MPDREMVPNDENDLLKDLMRLKPEGMTPNRWASQAGVSRTVWSDMRRHGNPARRTLEKLLTAAGSSLAEFEALRVGAPAADMARDKALGDRHAPAWRGAPLPQLPVRATSAAGEWGLRGDGIELVAIGDALQNTYEARPASLAGDSGAYALTVIGDSMWPRFRPGRRIIVSPSAPIAIGDDVVVRLADGGRALIKELVRRSAGEIELRQFNPDRCFVVAAEDIIAIERVAGEAI